jgi:hypothetical protein
MGPGGPKPIRKHRTQGFPLWEGAKIIPVKMNVETGDTVPIRKFKIPDTGETRLFLDGGSYNPKQDDVEAHIGPYKGNRRFVWEVTVGDSYQEETTYQVIAAGLFNDTGSVPYTAGLKAIIDAPSAAQGQVRKPKRRGKELDEDRFTKRTEARLITDMEDTGHVVKGVFMWWTRGWELEWSMQDSEEVLVFDYDLEEKRVRAFRLRAIAGIGGVEEVNPKRYIEAFRERILQPMPIAA